jgi:hypothetical protein
MPCGWMVPWPPPLLSRRSKDKRVAVGDEVQCRDRGGGTDCGVRKHVELEITDVGDRCSAFSKPQLMLSIRRR